VIDHTWHLSLADELERLADHVTDDQYATLADAAASIRILVNRIAIINADRQVERRLAYKTKAAAR
jgi:hypothetical protein